jgi:hypothetical protein
MNRKYHCSFVLTLMALATTLFGARAHAGTSLQGYYEARVEASRADETLQMQMPNHYLELRALTNPWNRIEGFVELSASSNRFRNISPGIDPDAKINLDAAFIHDPKVFFNEGHVKLNTSRAEFLFFSSQNRFWFSQPLLNIVDGNSLQDDFGGPRAQAVRIDFWDLAGFKGLAYYGDKATNGEDFAATRVTREFSEGKVLAGTTLGRRDFGSATRDYDFTAAMDLELALGELFPPLSRFGRSTVVVEGGRNLSTRDVPSRKNQRNGLQMELRDFKIWDVTFKANGWYREPRFYTGMSSQQGNNDRRGAFTEAWYRVPRKQMDIRYAFWGERSLERRSTLNEQFQQYEHAIELYAELKGGFSTWVKYRDFRTNDNTTASSFKNFIFELQAQNKLISVRPQIRIRDIATPFAVEGYGMEINLNASSKWKFFARFLNANENTESRRTIFLQTRYSGFQSAEFFVEYGDGGRSDRLTENDSFVSEGSSAVDQDGERRVQAFLKLWF